jgi:hypothetical protein
MQIQNTAPGDFPVFWKWFRAQDKTTQTAHIKALIVEQDNKEYGLAALAEGHPALPANAGPLAKMFLGRTLL